MQSIHQSRFYSFRADANAVGGFLEEPFRKNIPTVAPVSLPPVGGFATARAEAFNLDEIVSCSSAYTRVSGTEHHTDGSISILTTAVVENLNILEVVTATRIVAQVSISILRGSSEFQISLTGSRFEGLWLAGRPCQPTPNAGLIPPGGLPLTWQDVQKAGQPQGGGKLLCSLVDGVDGNPGHMVEIPGFGRIFLGELRVSYDSVQLVAIRAELGCPVKGKISICAGGGGGHGEN